MLLYANAALFHSVPVPPNPYLRIPVFPVGPTGTLRALGLVPSQNRPGWSLLLLQENPPRYASMQPDGTWQAASPNDGPYEQCLVRGNNLIFTPRHAGEDQWVPAVFDVL